MVIHTHSIQTPHREQHVDDWVVATGNITVLPFIKSTDHIGPEGVIIVDLIEWIFIPHLELVNHDHIWTQSPADDLEDKVNRIYI